jgi:hypothetical protein
MSRSAAIVDLTLPRNPIAGVGKRQTIDEPGPVRFQPARRFATTAKWDGNLLLEEFVFWDSALQAQQLGIA